MALAVGLLGAAMAPGAVSAASTTATRVTPASTAATRVTATGTPATGTTGAGTPATARTGRASSAPSAGVGQPYAPNWFPEELLAWSPSSDPDAAYNRSTTPLAGRVTDRLTTANPLARPRRVMALSVFANTDGNPSQGSADFDYYTSDFWQYLDTLVFWGGSAGEGLILAPNPTVVDAAHRNGVPVLGTVFLPPTVYGGKLEWVRQLLTRDAAGHFPAAAKLAEAADYYGFDGWFVNQETEGADPALAADMRDFLVELKAQGQQVLWYDSMVESGEVDWQDALTDANDGFFAVSDLMFLNYGWNADRLASSAAHAKAMGRDPADLHAGVDVGWRQFAVQSYFDTLFPDGGNGSGVSLALYRPDFTLTGTDDRSQYAERDARFWVGADDDPSTSGADADGWRGVSTKVAEHAVVTHTPFVTRFGDGRGRLWAYDGKVWQRGDWNNLSAQDVLPTWRWIVRGAPLTVDLDHGQAWRGGSSLHIRGDLTEPTTIPLYATRLTVGRDTRLRVTATGDASWDAVLRFADQPGRDVVVPLGDTGTRWRTHTAALGRFGGRALVSVGLRLRGAQPDLDVHVGEFALLGHGSRPPAAPVNVEAERSGDGVRVHWVSRAGEGTRYEVEAVTARGDRTWLGATTGSAFYAAKLPADTARVEVVPVGADGRRAAAGSGRL
ncbi:endo-beta-N-acetylglucosaminidase [Actinopolymorpha cephalotaxi]|uniref:endo-beta-N-acetylglucosaminidase n=1 Tax=Actinopolymorpha cephalotaxi TaxID=504797 RepID=UPI002ED3DDB3